MISIQDREKIKHEFDSLTNLYDLSRFLNTTKKQLIYYTIILPEEQRYSTFFIPKKNGGARQISAPVKTLKYLQKQLALKLQVLYEPLNVVHGFLKEYENKDGLKVKPTVVTNAAVHVRKKFILNIDLENFFPTVSKKRVYGLFKNQYLLNSKIASYLTFICCTENGLPQGAPTSPIITNMICSRLDRKLRRLSSENYVTYSRYADDLSFSTSKKKFPSDFESKVNEIIKAEGFSLNEKKRRLHIRENRLEVTGLTVNVKPNVQRRYVRNLRAIFHSIGKHGINAAAENYVKIKNVSINDPAESLKRYLKGKIEFLGQVKGKNDPVYIKFKQNFLEVFEPDKRMKEIINSESMDFNYKRLKLLEKYNSEIVASIKDTSDELKNIKKRINQKLEKAASILVSKDEKNYYETIYLIWYSCLNEFQKLFFQFKSRFDDGPKKYIYDVFLEGRLIDFSSYYRKKIFSLPGFEYIRHVNLDKGAESISPKYDDQVAFSIPIYLFERKRGESVLEFSWLSEIRNRLNLTHSDKVNIKRDEYYERVDWTQCSWMFQFIYFLFTSNHIKRDEVFLENKYLNNHNSGDVMKITGKVDYIIPDKSGNKFEIIILFGNDVSTSGHKIKAEIWKTFNDSNSKYPPAYAEKLKLEAEKNYDNYLKQNIEKGDTVRVIVEYYLYKTENRIRIKEIEKLTAPKFLAIFEGTIRNDN